jgi:peptide-methionine (S)-S-oxide reductase
MSDKTETAILAGGCFWIMQQLLRDRDGVISTHVGRDRRREREPDGGE